jgi:alkylhydroperoxidase family enzyme
MTIMGNQLRQVSKRDASPEVLKIYQELFGDKDPVAEPGTATGTPGDYWTTYALVPEILTASRDTLMGMLQPGRPLDARFRELAILRAGIVGDSRFEYSQHMKVARMVGIPE